MTPKRIKIITVGIMLSLFLASMEGTVVATAMPTIVAQLGGLSIYSWVFSIYMLASTATVPIYGKLSDIFGRKKLYVISMVLFLSGSILCGLAGSMQQLIVFRAIQGLGAGGVLPIALIIIGEIFNVEERAKMQGYFSGVWGVSSIGGPLIGGVIVDQISWHWVFLINLFPGLIAMALVLIAWNNQPKFIKREAKLDFSGAALLSLSALSLLLGLNQIGSIQSLWFISASIILFVILMYIENKAEDPILPLHMFRDRLFVVAILHGVLSGWAMFGSISYVPLFVQAVLGTSATIAGITLTPMSLIWTISSIIGSWMLLRMSFRSVAIIGSVFLTAGCFFLTTIDMHSKQLFIMIYTSLMGIGMGLTIPVYLISIQTFVAKQDLGVATSTIQFSRNIGGTLGVSILGVILSTRLSTLLLQAGQNAETVSLNSLINALPETGVAINVTLQQALGTSMANMFIASLIASIFSLIAVFFTPKGHLITAKKTA
ncbi:MAG: MFS transporter [Anaerolineaceae bacterium]|nr:MFS transporter [Anaerolineaceae bacterium]